MCHRHHNLQGERGFQTLSVSMCRLVFPKMCLRLCEWHTVQTWRTAIWRFLHGDQRQHPVFLQLYNQCRQLQLAELAGDTWESKNLSAQTLCAEAEQRMAAVSPLFQEYFHCEYSSSPGAPRAAS